jgi:hypothetical protein
MSSIGALILILRNSAKGVENWNFESKPISTMAAQANEIFLPLSTLDGCIFSPCHRGFWVPTPTSGQFFSLMC